MTISPDDFGMNLTTEEREQMETIISRFNLPENSSVAGSGAPTPDAVTGAPEELAPPVAPPAPGYQVGDVIVSEEDAPTVASIYAFLRNNPHRAAELRAVMDGPPPAPAWQTQTPAPTAPVTSFIPGVSPTVLPGITPTPLQIPPGLDLDDPSIKFMFERQQLLEQQNAQILAAQQASQQAAAQATQQAAQRDAETAREAQVTNDVRAGIERFKILHPDLSEEDFGAINAETARLNIFPGLAQRMPYDQAITQSLELVYARRSLLPNPAAATNAANAQRKASLTALAGSGSSGGSVGQPLPAGPPPVGGRPSHGLNDRYSFDRNEALRLIEASGSSLGSQI